VTGPAEAAEALLRAPVEAAGCELVDVTWAPGLLRVSVDRDGGIDLETIGDLSPVLSAVLDEAVPDPLPGRYVLEVSSPGLERPLTKPHHFPRFVGTTVNVKLTAEAAGDGDRRLQGVLEAADDDGIVVAGRRFAHGELERVMTVFEWGPTPKKGGKAAQAKKKKSTPGSSPADQEAKVR
jgi:ribosome maturation factor RimP